MNRKIIRQKLSLLRMLIVGSTLSLVLGQYYYFDAASTTDYPYQQGCSETLYVKATTESRTTGVKAGLFRVQLDPLHFSYSTSDLASELQSYLFQASSATFSDYTNPLLSPSWIDPEKTILHIDRYQAYGNFVGNALYGILKFIPKYSPTDYTGTFSMIYVDGNTTKTSLSYAGENKIISGHQAPHITGSFYVLQQPCQDDITPPTDTVTPNGGTKKSYLSGVQLTLTENAGGGSVPYVWTGGLPGIGTWTGNIRGLNNQYGVNFSTFELHISGNGDSRYFTGGMFSSIGNLIATPSGKTRQFRDKNYSVNIKSGALFDYGIEKTITITGKVFDRRGRMDTISASFNHPQPPTLIPGSANPANGASGLGTVFPIRLGIQDEWAGVNSGTIVITLSGINGTNYGPYTFTGNDLHLSGIVGDALQPDYYITITGQAAFPTSGHIQLTWYAVDMEGTAGNGSYVFHTAPSCADYGCCLNIYLQTGTNPPFFYTPFVLNVSGGINPSFTRTPGDSTGIVDCGMSGSKALDIYKGTEDNSGSATYVSYHDLPNLVFSGVSNVKATLSGNTLYLEKIFIPTPPICGDGICNGSETCSSCSSDCGICGGGGGGSNIIAKDDCELPSNLACANEDGIDYSDSFYDNICCGVPEETGHAAPSCDVSDSPYDQEITDAFLRGYNLNITNKCPIDTARLDDNIKRIEAAKMLTMFTIQVIGLYPDTHKISCNRYDDISSLTPEMKFYAKTSCQLDIMGLEQDGETPKKSFYPYEFVDRAQFGTMLSRLIYGDKYNIYSGEETTYQWYEKHLAALNRDNIMTKIENPWMLEKRSRVLIMLYRVYSENLVAQYRLVAPAHNGAIVLLENVW